MTATATLAEALALLAPAVPYLGAVALLVAIVVVAESPLRRRRVREAVAPLLPTVRREARDVIAVAEDAATRVARHPGPAPSPRADAGRDPARVDVVAAAPARVTS